MSVHPYFQGEFGVIEDRSGQSGGTGSPRRPNPDALDAAGVADNTIVVWLPSEVSRRAKTHVLIR
jgi:hypothetical protein